MISSVIFFTQTQFVTLKCTAFSGIKVPVDIKDIPKFEIMNGLRVNVYGYDYNELKTHIFPLYISPHHFEQTVNLLIITDNEKSHYILIKNIDGLLRLKTGYQKHMHNCVRCLQSFTTKNTLNKHLEMCSQDKIQRTVMPSDPLMKFGNFKYRQRNLITIYGDFEAIVKPCSKTSGQSELISEHQPSGYSYVVISPIPELCTQVKVYRGEDSADRFILDMFKEYEKVAPILNTVKEMIFTKEDNVKFKAATTCALCLKPLDWDDDKNPVVRDHDHVTGQFR